MGINRPEVSLDTFPLCLVCSQKLHSNPEAAGASGAIHGLGLGLTLPGGLQKAAGQLGASQMFTAATSVVAKVAKHVAGSDSAGQPAADSSSSLPAEPGSAADHPSHAAPTSHHGQPQGNAPHAPDAAAERYKAQVHVLKQQLLEASQDMDALASDKQQISAQLRSAVDQASMPLCLRAAWHAWEGGGVQHCHL